MKKFFIPTLSFLVIIIPLVASAAFPAILCPDGSIMDDTLCGTQSGYLFRFLATIHRLLNYIIPILITLGVVYFVWGVVQYVIADGEEAKTKGKDRIIYGIIGFVIIFSLWGLVNIVVRTFGIGGNAPSLASVTVGGNQSCALTNTSKLQDLLCYATRIINNSIIPLIFAVATAFFIWGAAKYFIINADEEAKRQQGREFMIWGIIAFTVMLSVWGLVAILGGTFGINTSVLPQVHP